MFDTSIPFYNIMILLSLIANVIVVVFNYRRFNFSKDEVIGSLVYENIGIIVGAKVLSYLTNYSQEFNFLSLGLSSFGGVIGAIIFLAIFSLQFKKSFKDMLFVFMPSIPLMYALGKIGCFLAGCCYGIKYDGLGHVVYNYSLAAPSGVSLFPVQIVESVVFILIFVYNFYNILKNNFSYKTLSISFILCGFAKFCLDYLRDSHVSVILSVNQVISLLFIIIGFLIIRKRSKTI